jgi:excisionase family DNA binding protein
MRKRDFTSPSSNLCEDGLLRPYPDAAQFLGISRSSIFQLMANGKLPYVRVVVGKRIPRRALVNFAESRLVERAS